MPGKSWMQIAIKRSELIARTMPHSQRGVTPVEGHADALCLFAAYQELAPIKQAVEDAGLEILGTGSSLVSPGESVFAMIVRSTDSERLSAQLQASEETAGEPPDD